VTAGAVPAPVHLRLEAGRVDLQGRTVLGPLDLDIEAGVPLAVTGPSGSGKTVLCLVLAGALEPTTGRVRLDGDPVPAGAVGLVLQTHGLVPALTADENVALPLQARRLPRADVARRAGMALTAVGLAAERSRPVDDLSGGERQRVGVARAIAGDPAVLVADEPTAELDPENRERVMALLTTPTTPARILVVASDDPEVLAAFPRVLELP
jgi:putative ABC transport system ATP-binding protein